MTDHITENDVLAWVEPTKMGSAFGSINSDLESQIAVTVLGALVQAFDTSAWVDSTTTPLLVRRIIAMRYVAWRYNQMFSADSDEVDAYATLLMQSADALLAGIISGSVTIPDLPDGTDTGTRLPGYYPTDASSAMCPTIDDPSLGGPYFSMGRVW